MAIHILIKKKIETSEQVIYEFDVTSKGVGVFSINKATGAIDLIQELDGDEKGMLFARAAHKIKRSFKAGIFPEREEWVS